jgi:chromosomal replication initiation ATPase DnaA|tara:strand:- start:875 stop:1168 length:294 start_codon:yes stop_codon:yes gene_type:complete
MKKAIFEKYATAVAKEFHLSEDEMFERTRTRECVDARFLLYYLCMERPIRTSYIQKYLKERGLDICHSTILHGYKKAKELVESDPDYKSLAKQISRV